MIKKIHLIMLGTRPTFSNLEKSCIDSWKKFYPDFEIKIWRDKDCIDWINESKFASYHYHVTQILAFVSDYLRCKILYEEGGLYMDIDVFCTNRLPDSYFEKSFIPWDVWGFTTNNGTCFYASEEKLPIFKEFADAMSESDLDVKMQFGSQAANGRVNSVLAKRGLTDFSGALCEEDIDLGDIVVYNRSQFGGRHGDNDGYLTNGKTVYFVHICSGSWVVPSFYRCVNVKYAMIYKDTDIDELKRRLRILHDKNEWKNFVFILFLTYEFRCDEELMKLVDRTYCLPEGNFRGNAADYICHRIADINSCHDIMREDYCG